LMSVLKGKKKSNIIKDWRQQPKSIEKFQFVHHFLPHPEEKRRATLLSNRAVIVYCVAMLLIAGIFRILPKIVPGVLGYASDIAVKDLLTYTNVKRKEAGLSELRLNSALTSAAHQKAEDMFKDQYWAHISPDGTEPWDFILGQNYDYIYAGENLAKNFNNSRDVVEAWMKSSSHKENLLSPNYDEIGFAVVNGVMEGYETTLVVQMFAVSEPVYTPVAPEKPAIDVTTATKTVSAVFGGFVGTLLALDVWYSKTRGIHKFTGHTAAHLGILILVVASIWFVLTPGIVL